MTLTWNEFINQLKNTRPDHISVSVYNSSGPNYGLYCKIEDMVIKDDYIKFDDDRNNYIALPNDCDVIVNDGKIKIYDLFYNGYECHVVITVCL